LLIFSAISEENWRHNEQKHKTLCLASCVHQQGKKTANHAIRQLFLAFFADGGSGFAGFSDGGFADESASLKAGDTGGHEDRAGGFIHRSRDYGFWFYRSGATRQRVASHGAKVVRAKILQSGLGLRVGSKLSPK
jgi:hypothetical protein